jgi:cytochrome c553
MKRLQILLTIVGAVAILAGALIVVSSMTLGTPAYQTDDPSHESIVYIGTNTCFTCHSDTHRDGWHALHPQVIQNPVANPQVILADFSATQAVRQIDAGSETRAFTADDVTYGGPSQRYIMKTEDGYAVLPGSWILVAGDVEVSSTDWTEDCAGCHGPIGNYLRLAHQVEPRATEAELNTAHQVIASVSRPVICRDCPDNDQINTLLAKKTFTSVVLIGNGDGKTTRQRMRLLQVTTWGKPVAYPIYRREHSTQ